jgi:hypothetical protein
LALSHLRVEEGLPMFSIFDTSNKIAWSDVYTAVLPLGAVEPEGLHLPVGFYFSQSIRQRFLHRKIGFPFADNSILKRYGNSRLQRYDRTATADYKGCSE